MMQKQKVQNNISLNMLAGGAFAEKFNEALAQVAENIQNPNTDATTKRQIQITLKFAPNKTRQLVNTQISVTTKLAATEAIDTQMIMGTNLQTGQIEIAEYDGQIRGQMSFADIQRQAAETNEEVSQDEQPAAVEQAYMPTGNPLDLRNMSKQPAPVEKSTEADALVPGRDYNPDTGEVLNGGQPVSEAKVVKMDTKAANA